MLQKIANYYLGILKKFGLVIPVAAVSASYVAMILCEAFNAFSGIFRNVLPLFIILACVGGAALIAGVVYVVLKLNSKEIGIQDLVMACLAVIAFLMLIMFCFTSGASWMTALKWSATSVVMLISLGFSVYRALKVVD